MAVASRKRLTADEYMQLADDPSLRGKRVELIDGEIIDMSPIGTRHQACVDRANRALTTVVGQKAIVRVQGSVRLNLFNQPQPDLALLKPRSDFYATASPGPSDILLVVEVAQSSIGYDRGRKLSLYARLGIHEYWLADLNGDVVSCYASPSGEAYRSVKHYRRGQSVTPELLPECVVSIVDLLGD
jgi:Uma2 family endonuclease